MPQATDQLRAEWPGSDAQAIAFLQGRGFVLKPKTWSWRPPSPDHQLSQREESAIVYLIDEWDFGGLDA